jgi:peroxiredoxin Q/BCP
VILGVSTDAPAANKAFKEKFTFPYDLLSDTDKKMSIAYGAATEESARASRVSVIVGPDGKIRKAYAKVSPADHPAEVLADLASIG